MTITSTRRNNIAGRQLIIGFCGPANSGKSLSAQYLVNKHRFARVPFAGPLKVMLAALGLTYDEIEYDLDGPCALLNGNTPAQAMQALRMEWSRELINAWRATVDRLPVGGAVVVEDCRSPNEANAIRALGGVLVRVNRARAGIGQVNFTPDLYVENDGTPAELCDKLDSLVAGLVPARMRAAA